MLAFLIAANPWVVIGMTLAIATWLWHRRPRGFFAPRENRARP